MLTRDTSYDVVACTVMHVVIVHCTNGWLGSRFDIQLSDWYAAVLKLCVGSEGVVWRVV